VATPDETRHDNNADDSLVAAAGRLAFYPARVAARASRDRIEAAVEEWLTGPDGTQALDRLLAGPLPEELARLVVKHRVLERMASELAASGDLERLAGQALESDRLANLARQTIRSDLTRQVINELSSSPELRRLIAGQTTGLGNELAVGLRTRARLLDRRTDRRREPRAENYAGAATRAIALTVDAALISLIATGLSAMVTLIVSLVGSLRPAWLVGLLLGAGWTLLAAGYFATCWSLTGQTLGMRLLHIRVRRVGATSLSPGRSLLRVLGLALAIVPCFAGFIPVLFDSRRRGLPDWLAGTSVEFDSPL